MPGQLSGSVVANLSPALVEELEIDVAPRGVVVVEVRRGTPAARLGLQPGDVLLRLNAREIRATEDIRRLTSTPLPWRLQIRRGENVIEWDYADLARTDDNNGFVILKRRKPDTGERLMFGDWYDDQLAAVAPALMKPRAQGVEGRFTVGGLVTLAWSLAALFLVGIPYAADPWRVRCRDLGVC